jgi:hypothetical protein
MVKVMKEDSQRPGFAPRSVYVRSVVDKVTLEKFLSEFFLSLLI